jgi:hypothetical protein
MAGPSVSWLLLLGPVLDLVLGLVLGLVKDGPDALGAFGDASLQAMS